MAGFGTLTLFIALVLATYGAVASVVGARRQSTRLIDSGRAAAYTLAAVLGLSSVAMVYAFVSGDYSIMYVARYSDASLPLFYKITSYWGGLDGSILWWAFLLSVFSAIAIHTNRNRHKEILPYTTAVLMTITGFFLYIIVFHKNPFNTYLTAAPAAGEGLNPLLQNAYMITHPPALYIGLVGMAIPYAFAMGALISGHLDDAWIASVRRWTLIAWFFLSMGLTLGMLWAYEELGWGGFWGWDPVENAGLLPWITATAFLHSVMIQERRGMMKIWNFTLIILTFLLTIIGTTMTRTGIVQSVHAFGQDNELLVILSSFMALVLLVSFGFMIARLPELRARGSLESILSREAAFLANNWILLFSAFLILFATMYPTLSEKFIGERINIGIPFFNKWLGPVGLVLLFLTGVGPLIAWRKATKSHLKYQFLWPGMAAAVTAALCLTTSLRSSWAAVICFALCAFVTTTIGQEFVRGAAIRKRNTGSDITTALLGMVLRGRRRYGGYIVHVGMVLMFLGFAGQAYQREEEVSFRPGQQVTFGRYEVRFDRLAHEEDRQKEMVTGHFTVFSEGKPLGQLQPARWYFHKRPTDPTTEVAIRRSPAEDLYLTMGNYDLAEGTVAMKLVINPLVDWIWVGFMLLAIGTGIALIPEMALVSVGNRVAAAETAGAGAAARGAIRVVLMVMLVLLTAAVLLLGAARQVFAAEAYDKNAERSWFMSHVMCMCGGCRASIGQCPMTNCHGRDPDIKLIDGMLAQGKSREEIVAALAERHGGMHFLLEPPNRGFNRLAWAVPYGLGIAGAGALAFGAWRYAKRTKPPEAAPPSTGADADMEDRLDDELSRTDT